MQKSSKLTRSQIIGIIVLALLLVGAVYYFQQTLVSYTVFSVSLIEIDPQNPGYEDPATGEWRGSFWVIGMTTSCTDELAAYTFDKAESEKGTNTVGDKTLVPQSTISIVIDPQQPYWERPIEIKSVTVVPTTSGIWQGKIAGWGRRDDVDVDAVYSGHYEWATGYWEAHTPFNVDLYKNGVLIGHKPIDTLGVEDTVRIPESGDEYITVTDLGKLATGYGDPELGDIMLFSMNEIFKLDTNSKRLVMYDAGVTPHYDDYNWGYDHWTVHPTESYSTYWYGWGRWDEDNSPAGYEFSDLIDQDHIGGWVADDDTFNWKRNPVAPVIFPTEKTKLPTEKQQYQCLIEYLSSKGVPKIDPYVWKQEKSPEIITESSTGAKKLRVYLPFGSMNSLITVKISTELADTIVWEPPVANIQIMDMPDLGQVFDRKTSTITVLQNSSVASSGTVSLTVSPTTAPLSINPSAQGTGTMNPGDIKTLTYEVVNLGTENQVDFTITAVVKNSLGSVTDTATATGTLEPKGTGETTLTVYTLDKETKEKVSGITVTATYDSQSKSGITTDGAVSWNFGSSQPSVTIQTAETFTYKATSTTKTLVAGPNSVTLELVRQGVEEETPPYLLWALAIAAVVIVSGVSYAAYKKRKKLAKTIRRRR